MLNGKNLLLGRGQTSAVLTTDGLGAFSPGERVGFLQLDVTIPTAATIKVYARAIGSGFAGPRSNTLTSGYTATLALVNATTGATVAGTTGITATGLYTFDVTGYEFVIDFAYGSGNDCLIYATLGTR